MTQYTATRYSVGLEKVFRVSDGMLVDVRSTGERLRVGRQYRDGDGRIWTITHTAQTHAPYVFYGATGPKTGGWNNYLDARGQIRNWNTDELVRDGLSVFDASGVAQSGFGGPSGPVDGLRLIEEVAP